MHSNVCCQAKWCVTEQNIVGANLKDVERRDSEKRTIAIDFYWTEARLIKPSRMRTSRRDQPTIITIYRIENQIHYHTTTEMEHCSPNCLINIASANSRANLSSLLSHIFVRFSSGSHEHSLQWCGKCEPEPFLSDRACSLRRSLIQRPDWPMYTLPQLSRIK